MNKPKLSHGKMEETERRNDRLKTEDERESLANQLIDVEVEGKGERG